MTEQQKERFEVVMAKLGKAHDLMAKSSLSQKEYDPIIELMAKAKVELFNLYNELKNEITEQSQSNSN